MSGCSATATIENNIDRAHHMVMKTSRLTNAINIFHEKGEHSVKTTPLTCSKQSQSRFICREGYDISFLGCKRH